MRFRAGEAFTDSGEGDNPPDYIYGRYKTRGSDVPSDDFFPVTYGPRRTAWLDSYLP